MKIFWKLLFINPISLCGLVMLVTMACSPISNRNANILAIFNSSQATEVFATGYAGISEKYIEKISIEDIAIEGLRGLGTIDPDLNIKRSRDSNEQLPIKIMNQNSNNLIILHYQGKVIASKINERPITPFIDRYSFQIK